MRLRYLIAHFVIVLAAVASALAQVQPASSGRDFQIALPSLGLGPNHVMRINITAVRPATVTLRYLETGAVESAAIPGGGRWERTIPWDSIMVLMGEHTSRRTIHVTSTDHVTVNVVSDAVAMSDGYTALPTQSLGMDYLAMSYPGIAYGSMPNSFGGVVAIIASDDSTTVRITPTVITQGGQLPGFGYSVTLQKGELYQITPTTPENTDMTGTRITASKPVAVLSGHRGVATDSVSAIDALIDQMPPIADWGRQFYAIPFPEQTHGRYRVLAVSDGTQVRANGLLVATLASGAVREFLVEGAAAIQTSQPALVVQLATHTRGPVGEISSDPSMMVLNPVDSYDTWFEWSTPTMAPRSNRPDIIVPWAHYVVITAPVSAASSVRLDGAPVTLGTPQPDGAWSSGAIEIQPGPHRLTAPQPINAQIYGASDFDAYAMPAGMRLREPLRGEPIFSRTCLETLDTTIIVRNVGIDPLQITSARFAVTASSRLVSPSLPATIDGAGTQLLRLQISLPRFGINRDTLILRTSTTGARPVTLPLEIVRDSNTLSASASDVRFATATPTVPQRDTTIYLINTGTGRTQVRSVAFSGPFTLVSPALPVWLEPGDSLPIRIRFAPTAPGSFTGTATVTQLPCGAPSVITLSGDRVQGALLELGRIEFPELACDTPGYALVAVAIRNRGGLPMRVDSLEIRGAGAGAFTVQQPPPGTMVAPGDSLVVIVRFATGVAGSYRASLGVWNSATPGGYYLSDEFTATRETVRGVARPDSVDFGAVVGCEPPGGRLVSLVNTGTLPLHIDSLTAAGSSFRFGGAGRTVGPGDSTSITVAFTPAAPGMSRDTLRIHLSPCGIVLLVPLSGDSRGAAMAAPDTIDLGGIADCRLPLRDTLVISNAGGVDLTVTSVNATGGLVVEPPADRTIAPGNGLPVAFTVPAFSGILDAEIVLTADPCGIERRVRVLAHSERTGAEITGDLDFGVLPAGNPVTRRAMLHNRGEGPMTVGTIGPAASVGGLRVVRPPLPVSVAAGDSIEIEMEYLSGSPASFATTLVAAIDSPCAISASLPLEGQAYDETALSVWLPDTSGWIDVPIAVPLMASRSAEGTDPSGLTVEVRWDRTVLALRGITTRAGGSVQVISEAVQGRDKVVRLEYRGPLSATSSIAMLDLLPLLGEADATQLRVSAVEVIPAPGGGTWRASARDGSFKTLGICRIDGARLVRIAGMFRIVSVAPNPTGGRVVVNLEGTSAGDVAMEIFDALGRKLVSRRVELAGGRVAHEIDLAGVPSGDYALRVTSAGGFTETHVVRVAR